jgi:hypothetical protein
VAPDVIFPGDIERIEKETPMKKHDLNVTIDASLKATVSDPMHHIDSGDEVTWHVSAVPPRDGDTLDMELPWTLLSTKLGGISALDCTVVWPGSRAGDEVPYRFFLTKGGVRTELGFSGAPSPLGPGASGPSLVLDTNGPPIGGSGCGDRDGDDHHPHRPRPSCEPGGETPDRP